jgi:hypothetical protein
MSEDPVDVACPYQSHVSPHVQHARVHLGGWVRDSGLIRGSAARARFERADFAWFAGTVYPRAGAEQLALMAEWFAWLFLVDDQLDDGALGTDDARAQQMRAEMRALLGPGDYPDPGGSPVLAALADLWRRTRVSAGAGWCDRFAGHLDECLGVAVTWEIHNRVHGIIPDPETYVRNRRHTGAIYVCMDLIEIVEGVEVCPAIHSSPEFSSALDAACNVVCWTNDVYSLAKERSLGEVHNLVCVIASHRGLPLPSATRQVCAAIAAESARYLALEQRLLRAYPQVPALRPVVAGMQTWISGNNAWSRRTHRYAAASAADIPDAYIEPALLGE